MKAYPNSLLSPKNNITPCSKLPAETANIKQCRKKVCTIAHNHFFVAAYDGGTLVGFGHILTDGVLHAMIYEMIVHPDDQHLAIGTQIPHNLLEWCNKNRLRDIQLFFARGEHAFYEKNGFVSHPDDAPGMQYRRPNGSLNAQSRTPK
ncbi:MAG: hypothetical protein A2030_11590 [Chloroflexi bacterium RBG_19FT_COMBO_50_10]|nr:MAG: hypothetical protein A2030_11590 [Chloroflexi bacterium RBG_19FT_COMBO_50_10]